MELDAESDEKSTQQPSSSSNTRLGGKRGISQLGPLPSGGSAKKSQANAAEEVFHVQMQKSSDDIAAWAALQSTKSTAHDYCYTLDHETSSRIKGVTLPSDFFDHKNNLDRLISYLIGILKIPVTTQKPLSKKVHEDIPTLLDTFVGGVITGLSEETKVPSQWKEVTDPRMIAIQAITWKRLMANIDENSTKLQHKLAFAHPSVSGEGERTSFYKFYALLAKQEGTYSVQRAKLIKTLINEACKAYQLDAASMLDDHKLNEAELKKSAKPQTENTDVRRKKGAQKVYITKQVWEAETFPLLTPLEKQVLKLRKKIHTDQIRDLAERFNACSGSHQYLHYETFLKAMRGLYQTYYQEIGRISTSLHKRRTLFENYLTQNKKVVFKGKKMSKETVTYFDQEMAKPFNREHFAIVMDPRYVLSLAQSAIFLSASLPPEGDALTEAIKTICADHAAKYPNYNNASYVEDLAMCRTSNAFEALNIRAEDDEDEPDGRQ